MTEDTRIIIILLLLLLLFSIHAFFAATETALSSMRRSRIRHLAEEGDKRAAALLSFSEDSTAFLATIQLGTKSAGFLSAALLALIAAEPLAAWLGQFAWLRLPAEAQLLAILLVTFLLVFLLLIFGELVPKQLARRHAEGFALFASYPMRFFSRAARPLVRGIVLTSRFFVGREGEETSLDLPYITEEEIKTIVDAGEEEGVLEEEEKDMIYSIFTFGDTMAREVMIPRIDIVALEVRAGIPEALDVINDAGHSRIPVYKDNIDNIVGMLYAKDLLRCFRQGKTDVPLRTILREVYYIPETKKLAELLPELQQMKVHIAIVVDEYGGTAGLVTIEDMLEEIVGEIQDEYDSEEAMIEKLSENEFVFNARIDIDDVNDLMELHLPTEESDTMGGLIYTALGRVPQVGDLVEIEGVRITVLSVLGRRVRKVKVEKPLPPEDDSIAGEED